MVPVKVRSMKEKQMLGGFGSLFRETVDAWT
jgi:hypothetical protein